MKGEAVIVSQRVRVVALAALAGLLLAGAQPAAARPLPPQPTVELAFAAALAPDGGSVTLHISASCPDRWTLLEASVAVTQAQASGEASFPLSCTGATVPFRVTVQTSGGPFQLGEAQGTATVVIKRGRTLQAQDSHVVHLVPHVVVDLADTGRLAGGGQAVSIEVTSACPVGALAQQSYVLIGQGAASGQGFFVPTCDGLPHTVTVTVQASQGQFQTGIAQANAVAVVEHGGDIFFGEDIQQIGIVA